MSLPDERVPTVLVVQRRYQGDDALLTLETEDGKPLTAFRVTPEDVTYGNCYMHHSPLKQFFPFVRKLLGLKERT